MACGERTNLPVDRVHGYYMLLERHVNTRQPKKRRKQAVKIYVCGFGGIVSNVYAENTPEPPELQAIILDVDKEREDADLIEARWNEISCDTARYHEVEITFYDPLGDDGHDIEGKAGA